MKFGDYIRQKREEHGLTQPEAAARANIEQSYLSKLETGKSYPSEDIFTRLMDTYDIKVEDLCRSVFSSELDRLREIKEVRTVVLSRQKGEATLMRGWLITGIIMIMLGGAALGLTSAGSSSTIVQYLYRSEGVIKPGESPMIYSFMETGQPDGEGLTLTDRVDYKYQTLTEYKGPSFFVEVDGGHRKFTMYETTKEVVPSVVDWLLGPAFMFILGGLACFYVARRWR